MPCLETHPVPSPDPKYTTIYAFEEGENHIAEFPIINAIEEGLFNGEDIFDIKKGKFAKEFNDGRLKTYPEKIAYFLSVN